MHTKDYFNTKLVRNVLAIFAMSSLPLYFYLSLENHLLFHTIMSFSIMTLGVIGPVVGIFTSFRMKDSIMSRVSPAIFIYSVLLFIHMISYEGMNIFTNVKESFSSQIWMSANFILAMGFLITLFDRKNRIPAIGRLISVIFAGCLLFAFSFYSIFPETIINGQTTIFLKIAQGITVGIYLVTIVLSLFFKNFKNNMDYKNFLFGLILLAVSELILVNHFTSQGPSVFLGLAIRYIGFLYLVYTVIVVNVIRPYNALYTSLADDNILQRKLREENVENTKRLERSQAIGHVGSWELNLKTQKVWASNQAFNIYGLEVTKDNIIDFKKVRTIALPEDRPRLTQAMNNLIQKNTPYHITFTILNSKGDYHHIRSEASLQYEDDLPAYVIGVINDITELKNEQDKLLYASYHDHLTNVYNRRYFMEQRAALNFKKYLPVSTFILDINGLKIINDSFGHHIGNQVLKKLSDIISENITIENGFVARIGGDEFAMLLPNTSTTEAQEIMDNIIRISRENQVGNIKLSIAYGLATKEKTTDSFDNVLKQAEDDMYYHKLSNSLSVRNGIIDALLKTLYEKDTISEQHSQRVSELAYKLAEAANLTEKNANDIRVAGLLHDIGKITIANEILNKEGKLTDREFNIIKSHPEKGYRIIHSIGGMDTIANYVLQHHERYDGFGYPKKLSKSDISFEGKIICIADAYDAMTSFRSYKETMPDEEAIKELKACKGTQFDPRLVDIFIEKVIKVKQKT